MKKIVTLIIIIVLAFLAVAIGYSFDNPSSFGDDNDRATFNVSSEGPIEISKIIHNIKTNEYYDGYDNETLRWMESLGDKYVFSSSDMYVVMDKADADKIPSAYVCDAYFNEIFSAEVVESHSLGNIKYPKEVYLIKNVEYIGEEVHYMDV